MKVKRKTIMIDLDGVLNEYNGDFRADLIPPPKKDVEKFLEKLAQDFDIMLFTTRNKIQACKWLFTNHLDKYFIDVTNIKELSWIIIDDRCLKYEGDYNYLLQQIYDFKVWYKS